MAKKGVKITDRIPRKQSLTASDILKMKELILAAAGEVESCAAEMKAKKVDSLAVDGATKAKQGVAKIREFVANFQHAMLRSLIEE